MLYFRLTRLVFYPDLHACSGRTEFCNEGCSDLIPLQLYTRVWCNLLNFSFVRNEHSHVYFFDSLEVYIPYIFSDGAEFFQTGTFRGKYANSLFQTSWPVLQESNCALVICLRYSNEGVKLSPEDSIYNSPRQIIHLQHAKACCAGIKDPRSSDFLACVLPPSHVILLNLELVPVPVVSPSTTAELISQSDKVSRSKIFDTLYTASWSLTQSSSANA